MQLVFLIRVYRIAIYRVDNAIHLLNNRVQMSFVRSVRYQRAVILPVFTMLYYLSLISSHCGE